MKSLVIGVSAKKIEVIIRVLLIHEMISTLVKPQKSERYENPGNYSYKNDGI